MVIENWVSVWVCRTVTTEKCFVNVLRLWTHWALSAMWSWLIAVASFQPIIAGSNISYCTPLWVPVTDQLELTTDISEYVKIVVDLWPTLIKNQDICILDLLLIVLVFVLALELHILMLVSAPVSFLFFLCINICVVFFVQVTSFNERNASLVAFQVL